MADSGLERTLLQKGLKRIYEEIHRAQYRGDYASAGGFERQVKEVQDQAKRLYPDNEFIKNLGMLGLIPYAGAIDEGTQSPHLTFLKLRVATIADAIGLELPILEDVSNPSQVLNINQIAWQQVVQSIDNIVGVVNQTNLSQEKKAAATALIREFEEESKSQNPDSKRLWNIVCKVGTIAKDIGYMLFQHGLEKGLLNWNTLPS